MAFYSLFFFLFWPIVSSHPSLTEPAVLRGPQHADDDVGAAGAPAFRLGEARGSPRESLLRGSQHEDDDVAKTNSRQNTTLPTMATAIRPRRFRTENGKHAKSVGFGDIEIDLAKLDNRCLLRGGLCIIRN